MDHQIAVARNSRVLFWSKAFLEAKILAAVVVLFYQKRGVTLDGVYYLSIVWAVVSLITEVPSGYLADRIGRKKTILIGIGFFFVANVVEFFAYGFWQFAVNFALMSIGFSCLSGTVEAMLSDSLLEIGQHDQMQEKNAKQHSSRFVARIFLPVIAAVLARDLQEWQFRLK